MNPRPCFQALQYRLCSLLSFATLLFFLFSDYKNIFLPFILHFYQHLFAELVHLYKLSLYWVCWGHKRFLVFGCRVVWERPSSSHASHALINLWSSTWGKIAPVLENAALGGPTRVYKNKATSYTSSPFLVPFLGRWVLEGISLDLAIESLVSCFITSLVYN